MAAKGGHAEILKYLLSKPEQLVSVNERNQNILDIAIEARQEAVAMGIVEHKRLERVFAMLFLTFSLISEKRDRFKVLQKMI